MNSGKIREILAEWFGVLLTEKERKQRNAVSPGDRCYTVRNLILMFFILSVAGWLWEVGLGAVKDGIVANRGVLHGPWLPVYGRGAVLILVLLKKLRDRPGVEFAGIVVISGCMEYFISWFLEIMHGGQRWWDYSGYFLNLNGRICAAGLLLFGAAGMAVVYFVAPFLDDLLNRVKPGLLTAIVILLAVMYVGDQIYSAGNPNTGNGITECMQSFSDEKVSIVKVSVENMFYIFCITV